MSHRPLSVALSPNGRSMVVDGALSWHEGSFDAIRSLGQNVRHPLDWGDRGWATVGAFGVLHVASNAMFPTSPDDFRRAVEAFSRGR